MTKERMLEQVLYRYFGHEAFREGQKEAIMAAVNGQDSLVMLPTGTGKSVCYQLSGYLLDGLTVIVSPLLSLMEDQVGKMRRRGEKRVAALNSLLKPSEKRMVLQSLNKLKFLFLSPEMLDQPVVMNQLEKQKISLLAIDEAHCISQWGFDFRPEYLYLGTARRGLGYPVTMALTATATKEVQEEIKQILGLKERSLTTVLTSVDRPNIYLKVESCRGNKDDLLLHYASKLPKPGIVYFSSKKTAERCAKLIQDKKIAETEVYHSTITSEDKIKIQAQFTNGKIGIVCATSAFGMGIDKADIRFVIHYHMPGSPEQYLQELGRCGRDGKQSGAVILSDEGDLMIQHHLIEKSYPTKHMLEKAYASPNKICLPEATETQEALSRYYVRSGYSYSEACSMIEERREKKLKQLSWMHQFVTSDDCLREQVLHYFAENSEGQSPVCCSNCQENWENTLSMETSSSLTDREEEVNVENWTKLIQNLFRIQKF